MGWGRIGLGNARPSHQSDVEASLHRQRAAWAACRGEGFALDVMKVRLTVDARGAIVNATSIAPGASSPAQTACVLGALRRLTVPPPEHAPHAVEVTLRPGPDLERDAPSPQVSPPPTAPATYADHIQRTIRNARGAFRLCHEQYLRCCPNLSDRVDLSFTIEKDGAVTRVAAGSETTVPQGETRCVLDAVRSLSFPAPPEGRVVVRYPVRFSSDP